MFNLSNSWLTVMFHDLVTPCLYGNGSNTSGVDNWFLTAFF